MSVRSSGATSDSDTDGGSHAVVPVGVLQGLGSRGGGLTRADVAALGRLDPQGVGSGSAPALPRRKRHAKFTCCMLVARRKLVLDGRGPWVAMHCHWPCDVEALKATRWGFFEPPEMGTNVLWQPEDIVALWDPDARQPPGTCGDYCFERFGQLARQGQAEAAGPDAERVNEVFANTPQHSRPLRGDRAAVRSKVVMKVVAEPRGFRDIKEMHLELHVEEQWLAP